MTLIELLSSFAILAILVTLLAVTFNTVTDAWHSAQSRTRIVTQARAVMETIVQDLRQAVATTNFPITIGDDPVSSYGSTNNTIQFVRILPAAETNLYAIEIVCYSLTGSNETVQLVRRTHPLPVTPPEYPPNHLPGTMKDDNPLDTNTVPRTLADGLAALRFSPPVANTNLINPVDAPVWPYLDVYFELLGDDDRRTAATLAGSNQTMFVERQVLRFSQRIFLPAVNRWNLP